MKFIPTLLMLFITIVPITPQANTKGYSLLLKHTGKKLSRFEKQQIYSLLASDTGITVTHDGENLIEEICDVIDFEVRVIDLNRDNKAEVAILGGNICLSGMTGHSLWLFIKDKSGNYQRNFGFPAADYKTLKTKSKGYPDLLIEGRGFCFPVWRWNGNQYQHYRNEAMSKDGCKRFLKHQ